MLRIDRARRDDAKLSTPRGVGRLRGRDRRGTRRDDGQLLPLLRGRAVNRRDRRPAEDLVTYEFTVDDSGEEFGFVYVSRFRAVARLQRSEIERTGAPKQSHQFGTGLSGLGKRPYRRRLGASSHAARSR